MESHGTLLLQAALVLYSLGLLDSLYSVVKQRRKLFKPALYAFVAGATLHLLSLASNSLAQGRFPVQTLQQLSSMASFFMTAVFLAVYARFKYESLAVFVFPPVFLLTLAGTLGGTSPAATRPMLEWWISIHAALFLLGYAALFLTCVAGVMYLIQERELKSKRPRAFYYRLPPLGKLDEIGYQALAAAFVLVTLGLIAASVWAFAKWGPNWVVDPTIALAFLTWGIAFAMVISRLAAGWRGRKGAYFSIAGFACAALTWVVNSGAHTFTGQ
jgi:ABC-type uncharacterized transport system permease subunit